jgi:hypothetical protein
MTAVLALLAVLITLAVLWEVGIMAYQFWRAVHQRRLSLAIAVFMLPIARNSTSSNALFTLNFPILRRRSPVGIFVLNRLIPNPTHKGRGQ